MANSTLTSEQDKGFHGGIAPLDAPVPRFRSQPGRLEPFWALLVAHRPTQPLG